MTYDEFAGGVDEYQRLFEEGLKKRANGRLTELAERFRGEVSRENADELLFRFCREFYDEGGFPGLRGHGCARLPYQLMGLLHEYLARECAAGKMPQLRWAYQLGGRYYNPFDPRLENDPLDVLERAYRHPECDQRTAELYFKNQIYDLSFGAHHFPDGCCIARESFENDVKTAEMILSEHVLPPEFAEELEYYKTLYRVFYEWRDGGENGDFAELCERAGLKFRAAKAFYYD